MSLSGPQSFRTSFGQADGITKPSIKVIFLDLDGVLVRSQDAPGIMDGNLVMNLKSVVEATGAQIVLSSDWRRTHLAAQEARRQLQAYGLDFISCTASLPPFPAQRPTEIMQWKNGDYRSGQISTWIAIDDRFLLEENHGYQLQGHFVHTDPMIGLDHAAARQCIQLLQQESADGLQGLISSALAWGRTLSTPTINYGPSSVQRLTSSEVNAMDAYQQRDPFGPGSPTVGKYDPYSWIHQEAYDPFCVAGINSTPQGTPPRSVTELQATRNSTPDGTYSPTRSNAPMIPWFQQQHSTQPYRPVWTRIAGSNLEAPVSPTLKLDYQSGFGVKSGTIHDEYSVWGNALGA